MGDTLAHTRFLIRIKIAHLGLWNDHGRRAIEGGGDGAHELHLRHRFLLRDDVVRLCASGV